MTQIVPTLAEIQTLPAALQHCTYHSSWRMVANPENGHLNRTLQLVFDGHGALKHCKAAEEHLKTEGIAVRWLTPKRRSGNAALRIELESYADVKKFRSLYLHSKNGAELPKGEGVLGYVPLISRDGSRPWKEVVDYVPLDDAQKMRETMRGVDFTFLMRGFEPEYARHSTFHFRKHVDPLLKRVTCWEHPGQTDTVHLTFYSDTAGSHELASELRRKLVRRYGSASVSAVDTEVLVDAPIVSGSTVTLTGNGAERFKASYAPGGGTGPGDIPIRSYESQWGRMEEYMTELELENGVEIRKFLGTYDKLASAFDTPATRRNAAVAAGSVAER